MSEVRNRTIDFLCAERDRLLNDLQEVDLLLDVLDASVPAPPEPGLEAGSGLEADSLHGGIARMKELDAENQRRVLEALANGSARLTINQIAERTGMPRPTVRSHTIRLYEAGRLDRRPGQRSGDGGRVPYVYELVATVEEREHHLDEKTKFVLD